jgi:hypothetical protein
MRNGIYSTTMVMSPEGDGGGTGGSGSPPPVDGGSSGSLLSQPPAANTNPPAAGGAPPPDGGTPPVVLPIAGGAPIPTMTLDKWKESLPEDIRNDPALKHITDIQGLTKSYLSGQKMIGADKVPIPGKHATPDDWKAFYQRIGHPANLQDYKLELPNDAGFDEEFVGKLREQAFELGILPNQMNKLLGWYSGANKSAIEKMNTDYKTKTLEAVGSLQKEWGQAFGDKVETAKRAAKYFAEKNGIPNINTWLDGTGMGDDPTMIKFLAFLGGFLKEDGIHGAEFTPSAQTPNQIDGEIKTILGDPKHPYFDKTHPNHKAAVDHMQKLYGQMFPPSTEQRVV